MNIYRSPQYLDHLLSVTNAGPARSSGVHLSGIIKHLAVQHGIYGEELLTDTKFDETTLLRFHTGFAWEHWCAGILKTLIPTFIHQPGEIVCDGIYMSPDGIAFADDSAEIINHEFKATWTSPTKTPIQERYPWLWSFMGYAKGLAHAFGVPCTTTVVHPLYINGDYRDRRVIYDPVTLVFTQEEIETNWRVMLAGRPHAKEEIWD